MSGNWDNGRLWINGINGILFHIALQCAEEEVKGAPHKGLKILEGLHFENWAALIGCYLPICSQLHTYGILPIHNLSTAYQLGTTYQLPILADQPHINYL